MNEIRQGFEQSKLFYKVTECPKSQLKRNKFLGQSFNRFPLLFKISRNTGKLEVNRIVKNAHNKLSQKSYSSTYPTTKKSS